jgi:hypothetical protein
MAFTKGAPKPPGSGRKKGTVNKDSLPLKEKAQALGVDPFEILLHFAAGDWKSLGYEDDKNLAGDYIIQPQVRVKAAGDACQYLHPKLKQIEAVVKNSPLDDRPLKDMSDEELESYDVS